MMPLGTGGGVHWTDTFVRLGSVILTPTGGPEAEGKSNSYYQRCFILHLLSFSVLIVTLAGGPKPT